MPTPRLQLVIGDKAWSSWSLRPWLALQRLGIAFEEISVRLRRPGTAKEILAHSPSGKVPALIVDGAVIWETLAILEYLAEDHPSLWPADRMARARARAVSAEMHSGFQALRQNCQMDFLARAPRPDLPAEAAADVRRVIAIWRGCRAGHGTSGPFLFGTFTAADAMFAPVASRFRTYLPDLGPFGDDGSAGAYVDTIFAMPEIRRWEAGARAELA